MYCDPKVWRGLNTQPLIYYQNLLKYDVTRDFYQKKDLKDLTEYKKKVLIANGFAHLVDNLYDPSPQFRHNKYDEEGLELSTEVEDTYPVSLEDEKKEILLRAKNLEYLSKVHHTFEYCRTRCKVADQRLRNITAFPRENQMCVTDCMNIRTENFNIQRPETNPEDKNFVWLA
jgi:hypothetical protein